MPAVSAENRAFVKAMTVEVPAAAEKAARKAMEKGADEIVAMMKRLVPKRTGRLRDSIGWTWGQAPSGARVLAKSARFGGTGRLAITIYAGNQTTMVSNSRGKQWQLARLQEFGTVKMAANPFFFPSWRANRSRVRGRMRREIKYAIEAYSGGLVGRDIAA